MTDHSFDDWTPEERAELAEIGRHRSPRSELKGRTINALRQRGLLGAAEIPRPRRQFAFALAAALVLFAAGLVAGYSIGLRRQAADSMTGAGGVRGNRPANEIARLDSPSTESPVRHVVWF